MNKNIGIALAVVVLAVIAGGVYASMKTKDDAMMASKMDDSAMAQKNDDTMVKKDSDMMVKKDAMEEADLVKEEDADMMDKGMEKDDSMMKGSYEAYSPEKLARAETGDVVLFFHASWCPSCRGLNADIEKNLETIPSDLSILKVDYDTESEMKKKYGVTYQHTLVQVDAKGAMIKKWSGSPTLSRLVSEIE